jgi:hypothetical protein
MYTHLKNNDREPGEYIHIDIYAYVCMYLCMSYIHIPTYTHAYIHTCMHTYIHTVAGEPVDRLFKAQIQASLMMEVPYMSVYLNEAQVQAGQQAPRAA